jgi:putative phage-type endonuclease
MIVHTELLQGSPDWLKARLGKISASKVSSIMGKRGFGKTGETYAVELTTELILQEPTFVPVSFAMEFGTENEPFAREIYEDNRGVKVEEVGGIEKDGLWFSPDGLVGEDGIIEIKCPQPSQHMRNLLSDTVLAQYTDQIQFGLMVTGRKWCDFISFNPNFPDQLKAKVIRVENDYEHQTRMSNNIDKFKILLSQFKNKLV